MAARDPKVKALADLKRAKSGVDRLSATLGTARMSYREKLRLASEAGVSRNELARIMETDPSRIRQLINKSRAEAESAR